MRGIFACLSLVTLIGCAALQPVEVVGVDAAASLGSRHGKGTDSCEHVADGGAVADELDDAPRRAELDEHVVPLGRARERLALHERGARRLQRGHERADVGLLGLVALGRRAVGAEATTAVRALQENVDDLSQTKQVGSGSVLPFRDHNPRPRTGCSTLS